jgi:DNA-binding MarR family transcriptional regulator
MSIAIEFVAQLHRAVHALGLYIDERFGPDLSQPEMLVLIQLLVAGPSTINDVHQRFLHRRSTLTSVLDRLEKKALVVRRPDADDRRSIRLDLTRSGRALATEIAETLEKTYSAIATRKQLQDASSLLLETATVFTEGYSPSK